MPRLTKRAARLRRIRENRVLREFVLRGRVIARAADAAGDTETADFYRQNAEEARRYLGRYPDAYGRAEMRALRLGRHVVRGAFGVDFDECPF